MRGQTSSSSSSKKDILGDFIQIRVGANYRYSKLQKVRRFFRPQEIAFIICSLRASAMISLLSSSLLALWHLVLIPCRWSPTCCVALYCWCNMWQRAVLAIGLCPDTTAFWRLKRINERTSIVCTLFRKHGCDGRGWLHQMQLLHHNMSADKLN